MGIFGRKRSGGKMKGMAVRTEGGADGSERRDGCGSGRRAWPRGAGPPAGGLLAVPSLSRPPIWSLCSSCP